MPTPDAWTCPECEQGKHRNCNGTAWNFDLDELVACGCPDPHHDTPIDTPPEPAPPVTKYRYTLTVTGNSHEEIEREVLVQTRGGYLLDSDYEKRDEFRVISGRSTRVLEHTNPDMTAERYSRELSEWADARRAERRS